jgi:hypothetical protein
MFRQRLGEPGYADIPGDMPRKLARGQPEIAEAVGDQPAIMIARQQKRRAPCDMMFENRWNIFAAQQS